MIESIARACDELRRGKIVLIFDAGDRENETDMVVASEFVDKNIIRTMRKDGGGLICVTVPPEARSCLGIPYMVELLENSAGRFPIVNGLKPNDIPYDTKSSFSLTINHRKTFTGITDRDRAMTISEFAKIVGASVLSENGCAEEEFARNFRAPGHVHLLNASEGLVLARQGHTELSTALMLMAGLTPSATICEMMGDDGNALPIEQAQKYASDRGLVLLGGREIIETWKSFAKTE